MAQANTSREVRLLLMGKTGAGKSATGNSLLDRKVFKVSGAAKSVTKSIKAEYSKVGSHSLKVIDGPGLEDTDLSDAQDKSQLIENIGQVLFECNGAISALVLVLKYGERFTAENKNCLISIINIFGKNILRQCGIVLMTNANSWYEEFSGKMNFQSWCKQFSPDYGGLFEQCAYRCVLFENFPQDQAEKETQRNEVLKLVSGTQAYTSQNFQNAEKERNKFIAGKRCLLLKESYQRDISLLIQDLTSVSGISPIKKTERTYNDIEERAETLLSKVRKDDAGSEVLADLQTQLENIISGAQTGKDEALKKAAEILQKLKDDRIWKIGKAVLAGIATTLTAGLATPVYVMALGDVFDNEDDIDKYTA